MKLLGQEYLTTIVKPLVHAVQKLGTTLEVDKNRLQSGDDYKKNLKVIQIILEDLVSRLAISIDQCPVPLRRLFAVIDRLAKDKFKESEKIRYTSVGGFVFLRFFVPAILNPKLFGLMEHLPDEKQSRTLSLLAGVLQKIANLTKYRDGDDYHVLLNDFIAAKTLVTKDYVDKLLDVPEAPLPRSRSMTRRSSYVTPVVQVEHHIASLLRELDPVIPKFKDEMFRPNVVKLLEILDKLEKQVNTERQNLELHDLSAKNTQSDLDSLVSDLIKSSMAPGVSNAAPSSPTEAPNPPFSGRSRSASVTPAPMPSKTSNRRTVKRLKKRDDHSAPSADSIFAMPPLTSGPSPPNSRPASSAYNNASLGIKLGGPVADISAFTAPGTQEKQMIQQSRSQSPPPGRPSQHQAAPASTTHQWEDGKTVTAAGALLLNMRKEQMMQRKGSAPPIPAPRTSARSLAAAEAIAKVDAANAAAANGNGSPRSPSGSSISSPRLKALAPHKDPVPALMEDDGVPISKDDDSDTASTSTSESSRVLADLNRLLMQEAESGIQFTPRGPPSPTEESEATAAIAEIKPAQQQAVRMPSPRVSPKASPKASPKVSPRNFVPPAAAKPSSPVESSTAVLTSPRRFNPPAPVAPISLNLKPQRLMPAMNFGSVGASSGELITPRRAVVTLTPRNEVLIEEEVEEPAPLPAVEDSSSDDEVDEPEEEEEVEVIDLEATRATTSSRALEKIDSEFQALNSMINEIIRFERPSTPRQRAPEEIIPEIAALDDILGELNVLQIETTRNMKEQQAKASANNRRRSVAVARVFCHFCQQTISPGQGFLIALNRQYHDNHLLCTRCHVDLSKTGLHEHENEPYCTDCYKYVTKVKSAPKCAGCSEAILDDEYFTALNQTWHVEHFICTTCRQPFDQGKFFMVGDKPYCNEHSRQAKPKQSRGICDYCQKDIFDAEYMDAQGKKWHKEHFLCDKCGLTMEGVFVLYDKGRKKACAHHFQKPPGQT